MKKWFPTLFILIAFLCGCNTNGQITSSNQGDDEKNESNVHYELLFQLDYIPPEVGSSISIVQDEKLYKVWADIFKFNAIPDIDFDTEEVLFVTAYSDGCKRELEYVEKEGETLTIKLNYPKNIRNKDIACTEIALQNTYVIKMAKTNTTKGKIIDINRIIYEEESIIQEKMQ